MLFATPVYIDSPMAISATEVFRNNLDCYDEEARNILKTVTILWIFRASVYPDGRGVKGIE